MKGKKYYYLEESFLWNSKLIKESVYIGAISPSNDEIFLAFEILSRTCTAKDHIVLVPPLTKYIKSRTAALLERTKNASWSSPSSNNMPDTFQPIVSLTQQKIFLESINFLDNEPAPSANSAKKLWQFYAIELAKSALLNESFLRTIHKHIAGAGVKQNYESDPKLIHLLRVWYEEKNGLIHPLELAAKFESKLIELSLFPTHSRAVARIASNYILQTHGFDFVNIPKRRKKAYEKALIESVKENYFSHTKLLCEELLKQRKKNSVNEIK